MRRALMEGLQARSPTEQDSSWRNTQEIHGLGQRNSVRVNALFCGELFLLGHLMNLGHTGLTLLRGRKL